MPTDERVQDLKYKRINGLTYFCDILTRLRLNLL